MSKRIRNVLHRLLPISLLETVQPCDYRMDITIEERMRTGEAGFTKRMRHIKVCRSQNECRQFDVEINPSTGIGTITIFDLQPTEYLVVETDDQGQQLTSSEGLSISYIVDGQKVNEEYASVDFDNQTHHAIHIIHHELSNDRWEEKEDYFMKEDSTVQMAETELSLELYQRTSNGQLSKPMHGEYSVRVRSEDDEQIVVLCEDNEYQNVLCGLNPGFYDVSVLDKSKEDSICYMVNGRKEQWYAHVEIMEGCRSSVVMLEEIQFEECDVFSPLRICAYVRDCNGCIQKPNEDMQFQVMVCGCGKQEVFNLNANNNFCVDIANICNGEYCIEDVSCNDDFTTSYIINDGKERTSACVQLQDDNSYCISIIHEERNAGALRVSKYLRNDCGELIRPNKDQCFHVTLRSFFSKQCFELHAENDWTILIDNLRFGSYEIKEDSCDEEYQVTYQLNHGKEMKSGRFIIDNCKEHEVRIINRVVKQNCGILKIDKFEETRGKQWVKPASHKEFEVYVESSDFRGVYTLKASNNFCVLLEGLEENEYRIYEKDAYGQEVSYFVNQKQMHDAIVCMDQNNQEVCILNHFTHSGMLKLNAKILTCEEVLQYPSRNMVIDVLIEGRDVSEQVSLHAQNNWCVVLDHLDPGHYRIIQKDNFGYKIHYRIQGQDRSFGNVELTQNDVEVFIINEETNCSGSVFVTKYVEDAYGNLEMPNLQDEFRFLLQGQSIKQTYKLCARNDFCIYFDDLSEGQYEITELDSNCHVTYHIQGKPSERGCFTLAQKDVYVDIVNLSKENSCVVVEKRIQQGNQFVMPPNDACFKFLLKGKGCHEIYELHAGNDFCISFNHLKNQHYEVKELNSNRVIYDVNGEEMDSAYFLYDGSFKQIKILNLEERYGCMMLEAKVKDDCGNLGVPHMSQSFGVMITSDTFYKQVELNSQNDFCIRLYDLPQGHYEIQSRDEQDMTVSWLINGMPYSKAVADIQDEDVCVTMIQTPKGNGSIHFTAQFEENSQRRDPLEDEEVKIEVTNKQNTEIICLHDQNDFTYDLCDLLAGSYVLQGVGQTLRFEIEDCVFENDVCVELKDECIHVRAVVVQEAKGSITIRKYMEDQYGQQSLPDKDNSYTIRLYKDKEYQEVVLDHQNDWCVHLQNQLPGKYEICEMNDYDVRYQINDEEPREHGSFELMQDHVEVRVLNAYDAMAQLHLYADMVSGEEIQQMDDTQKFEIDIIGNRIQRTLLFNKNNRWHVMEELPFGDYEIKQSNQEQQVSYYTGNHEPASSSFTLRHDLHMRMLYQKPKQKGSILLSAYLKKQSCDCLKQPEKDVELVMHIRGDNYHQTVALNEENNWKKHVTSLPFGNYEITNQDKEVSFIINGKQETMHGHVRIEDDTAQVIVLYEKEHQEKGCIEICRLVQDEQGNYHQPTDEEGYWVSIKGKSDTSRVLLNKANQFHASVVNLRDGWYEIAEENERTSSHYVVNNASAKERGMVQVLKNVNTINIVSQQENRGSIVLHHYLEDEQGLWKKAMQGEYRIHISSIGYNEVVMLTPENKYSAVISNLRDGMYVIDALDEEDTYIIDGGSQVDCAIVHIQDSMHQVQILGRANQEAQREESTGQGKIQLHAFIRNKGELQEPKASDVWQMHISRPGYNEVFTLEQSNQFSCMIDNLLDGYYVIDEVTKENACKYCINQGSEVDWAVIQIKQDTHQVQVILEEESALGSLTIRKQVRKKDGTLTVPEDSSQSHIHISRPDYQNTCVLQKENNWQAVFHNIEDGWYAVHEENNSNVTYCINQGSEVAYGNIHVDHNDNEVLIIQNDCETRGSITLMKHLKNNNGELTTPENERFIVDVESDDMHTSVVLQDRNNFKTTLHDLENGTYRISEQGSDYEVTYRIDDGEETSSASVDVSNNHHDVHIINGIKTQYGSLHITKYSKQADGTLITPADGDRYRIEVYNMDVTRVIELNGRNNFQYEFNDLPNGTYRVREISDAQYISTYRINGGEEVSQAVVEMGENAENTVDILNELQVNQNTIEVFKYVLDMNGNYVPPQPEEVFSFRISGNGFDEVYELRQDNEWHLSLTTYPSGTYRIEELSSQNKIQYLVNSPELMDEAVFKISAGMTVVVGIINVLGNVENGQIVLGKLMKDAFGNLRKPDIRNSYIVQVVSPSFEQSVALDKDNDFSYTLTNLPYGRYTFHETSGEMNPTFIVNGEESTQGILDINSGRRNTVEVVNPIVASSASAGSVKIVID